MRRGVGETTIPNGTKATRQSGAPGRHAKVACPGGVPERRARAVHPNGMFERIASGRCEMIGYVSGVGSGEVLPEVDRVHGPSYRQHTDSAYREKEG